MTPCRLQSNYSSTVTLHSGPVVLRPVRATSRFYTPVFRLLVKRFEVSRPQGQHVAPNFTPLVQELGYGPQNGKFFQIFTKISDGIKTLQASAYGLGNFFCQISTVCRQIHGLLKIWADSIKEFQSYGNLGAAYAYYPKFSAPLAVKLYVRYEQSCTATGG